MAERPKKWLNESMNEPPTISASICIRGDKTFDPDLVTEAIKVHPTQIWRCKPQVAAQAPELDGVEWLYEIKDFAEIEYSNALAKIMDLFSKHGVTLQGMADEFELSISFHLVPRGDKRSFIPDFKAETIQQLASFNASLTIHSDRLE